MPWVIMPFLDCWDLTEAAATDVLAQTLPDVHLLLIDTGSTPTTREAAQTFAAQYRDRALLWSWHPGLPSLAATWNRALEFAWASGGDHAYVLNNDVRLHPETLAGLEEAARLTGGWFVSAANVPERDWQDTLSAPVLPVDRHFAAMRGGPDFSCYRITRDCHRWFQFDEAFVPAYHEDNDYHRRLQLAGFGDRIFSACVPYRHLGSATINRTPEIAAAFKAKFERCQQVYRAKWGDLPGKEPWTLPQAHDVFGGSSKDARCILFGQGRGEQPLEFYTDVQEAWYGQAVV